MRLNVTSSCMGPSTTLLVVTGVIDGSTITQFRSTLSPLIHRPGANVLVDLTGLLSWSSPGQAALVGAMTRARMQDGRLAIFGLSPIPARQAHSSGLHEALHPFVTLADAQAAPSRAHLPAPPPATGPGRTPAMDGDPVATSERRRRRADASARWAVQRQQRWRFVNHVET